MCSHAMLVMASGCLNCLTLAGGRVDAIRILIADGDRDSRTVYRVILQHHGYEVLEAEDGETALACALEQGVAVVVTELTLRQLDGHRLIERLRADSRTSELAVIVLTARALQADRDRARRAGCTEFLVKPVQPMELVEYVRDLTG